LTIVVASRFGPDCNLPVTASKRPPPAPTPITWLNNQPYLLLSLTSLFRAGNIVLGRYVAGHLPPITLACIRWIGALDAPVAATGISRSHQLHNQLRIQL
jgi:hypothetical protein